MKILVAGQNRGYNVESCIIRAFKQLGHYVFFFDTLGNLPLIKKHNIFRTLAETFPRLRSTVWNADISQVNSALYQYASSLSPDVFLAPKGAFMLPETVEAMRQELSVYAVLWAFDDYRLYERLAKRIAPSFDLVITSVAANLPRYKGLGIRDVMLLPVACDPAVHRKKEMMTRESAYYGSDLSFAGSFVPNRAKTFAQLSDFNLRIWGDYWYPFLVRKSLRTKLMRRPAYGEELINVINASKITLNVHTSYDIVSGVQANLRVFETTGCGCFLLTDNRSSVRRLFSDGKEVVCYDTPSELKELAEYYLENAGERYEISYKGQERAYAEHTYLNRVKVILNSVGKSHT